MKLSVLFLACLFALQITDIPPRPLTENPKTCCGRVICACTHARGARCDFRARKPASEHGAHCAMHSAKPAPADSVSEKKVSAIIQKIKTARRIFGKAPCHRDTPKSALPGHFNDYETSGRFIWRQSLPPKTFLKIFSDRYAFLIDLRLDRPPKVF